MPEHTTVELRCLYVAAQVVVAWVQQRPLNRVGLADPYSNSLAELVARLRPRPNANEIVATRNRFEAIEVAELYAAGIAEEDILLDQIPPSGDEVEDPERSDWVVVKALIGSVVPETCAAEAFHERMAVYRRVSRWLKRPDLAAAVDALATEFQANPFMTWSEAVAVIERAKTCVERRAQRDATAGDQPAQPSDAGRASASDSVGAACATPKPAEVTTGGELVFRARDTKPRAPMPVSGMPGFNAGSRVRAQ